MSERLSVAFFIPEGDSPRMIIDGHVHIWQRNMLPSSLLRAYLEPLLALDGIAFDMTEDREQDWPMSQVNSSTLLDCMKDARVEKAVVLPLDFGMLGETKIGVEQYNDWVFENCRGSEGRLIPFIGVDPSRGEKALQLLDKYAKTCDAKGVKVYPATGYSPDEERIEPFWKRVEDYGLIVVTHGGATWGPLDETFTHPILFKPVLERHLELKVVIAHIGGKFRSETYELAERFPNVYADCAALQGWLPTEAETCRSRLKEAVEKMPGRVIFGSDWPLFDMSYPYTYWARFVSEEPWAADGVKQEVLGGTIARLLRL